MRNSNSNRKFKLKLKHPFETTIIIESTNRQFEHTTTTGGYFAIQISWQTTKKKISESSLLRTIIPRKLLTFCDTITFAPVPSQVLHNSQT
jgi:hypothetical protein